VACFVVEKFKGYDKTDAFLTIFSYASGGNKPIVKKKIEKAQEMTPHWSPDGN